jgi:hypothetical protein
MRFWRSTNAQGALAPASNAQLLAQNKVKSQSLVVDALAAAAAEHRDCSDAGFSVSGRQSQCDGAGRGAFIEGSAPRGSVVCFYHGPVYQPLSGQLRMVWRNGEYTLCLSDGYLIDGMPTDGSISSLCGPLCNHPLPGTNPNVMYYSVVCNAYELPFESAAALERTSWYPQAPMTFDGRRFARTVVIVALRDLKDEELFVDYAYGGGHDKPDWYTAVPRDENGNSGRSLSIMERLAANDVAGFVDFAER